MNKVLTLFSTGRSTTANLAGILKDNSTAVGEPERRFKQWCCGEHGGQAPFPFSNVIMFRVGAQKG